MSDKPRDTLTEKVDAAFQQGGQGHRASQTDRYAGDRLGNGQVKEYSADELERQNSPGSPKAACAPDQRVSSR